MGLRFEEREGKAKNAIQAYQRAIEMNPEAIGAFINLGTIYFNARNLTQAERYYQRATGVDPEYALAHFDLANLYDERGDRIQPAGQHVTDLIEKVHCIAS